MDRVCGRKSAFDKCTPVVAETLQQKPKRTCRSPLLRPPILLGQHQVFDIILLIKKTVMTFSVWSWQSYRSCCQVQSLSKGVSEEARWNVLHPDLHLVVWHVLLGSQEERQEQLTAVTDLAAVVAGFEMIAFLQFQFDTTSVNRGLQIAYVITSGLTVSSNGFPYMTLLFPGVDTPSSSPLL